MWAYSLGKLTILKPSYLHNGISKTKQDIAAEDGFKLF